MNAPRTLVLGLGATGRSCVEHLSGRVPVAVCDTRATPPFGDIEPIRSGAVELLKPRAVRWQDFDRVDASPGLPLSHCLLAGARAAGVEVIGDIDLFLAEAQAPVVGITGTNGKSTVTALVGELLAAAGVAARVGGNLGTPALEVLDGQAERYVLELSSFQLERLAAGGIDVAALLNVSADHLDRHASLDTYAAAKRRIYERCRVAVYDGADAATHPPPETPGIALGTDPRWRLDGDALVLDGERRARSTYPLAGRHNALNLLAGAAIATLSGARLPDFEDALKTFRGLPHRCAPAGHIGGVAFVNDSKATNVGACTAALAGLGTAGTKIVLIAGGDGKGASFTALKGPVAAHARHAVLIGRDAERLAAALAGAVPTSRAADMDEAVAQALAAVRDGDVVLLSPACASFDMFDGFAARGDAFVAAVKRLGGRP